MDLLKTIPFFYKSQDNSNNGGFPIELPFDIHFDEELKMFRQNSTLELNKLLREVYEIGSLVEGSLSSESGLVYIDHITRYITENFNLTGESKVLEVGFGSGIILRELKNLGVKNLFGIEPGNHKLVSNLDGIKLIKDFFPSKKLTVKVDLIYTYGILEHIEDPLEFINNQIDQLTDSGKIIFSVPNCEPYLKHGDLSIFVHEHYSYFTTESIIRLINKTKCIIEDISKIEGAFIVTISKKEKGNIFNFKNISHKQFKLKVEHHISRIYELLDNYSELDIAVYNPLRALNVLYIIKKTNIRLVDDSSELHGKYLPSLSSKIESFDQLIRTPPKCLLIFSRTFGVRIKLKCLTEEKLKNTNIFTLEDLEQK